MSTDPTENAAISRLAAKLIMATLELLDRYDRPFFDKPLSDTFVNVLQYQISKATIEFLREHDIG